MSESKKLTFGRRTWNRDEYKSVTKDPEKAKENNFISTRITLPMGLEKRIQRQYNLTNGGSNDKKLIIKQRSIEDEENEGKNDKSNSKKFKCYTCGYQFNNDLKLIEHWNTDKHIERLTQSHNSNLSNDEERVSFPHNYEKNYSKDRSIIQQHLEYLQKTIYKP